jgi:regulator of replication initiation timing
MLTLWHEKDYNVTTEDIERDIEVLKENHLYNFAQRNARYRYSYYGVADDEEVKENADYDLIDKDNLLLRKDYIDGFHVNTTYTAYAHYWLIKEMLNVDKITLCI